MYFEEWELLTEPALLSPLPLINLSGMAVKEDTLGGEREKIEKVFNRQYVDHMADEMFEDMFCEVKTPTPDAPDMRDPATFQKFFEMRNRHLGLYFS